MKVDVEAMNIHFAKVMEIITYIGLAIMVVPGLMYLAGVNPFVDPMKAIENWDKSAVEFWKSTKGINIHGYSWFLNNLGNMDCISVVGVAILSLAPFFSVIASTISADKKYKILLLIVIIEFIIAIIRPLFIQTAGH